VPAGRAADWPRLLGEATIAVIVFVVPLIIHRTSRNTMDLKDFALGVGVVAGLALVLFSSLARGSLSWTSARLNVLVGAFLGWAAVSIVYSQYRFATISEAARLAAHVGLFWLVILSVREMRQVRRIVFSATLAAVALCIYAFMQAAGSDPLKWGTSTTRVFSFLGNATYLAGFLVLLIPLAIAAAWVPARESPNGARLRRTATKMASAGFFGGAAVMMLLTLYLTVTISPIMGLVLGVGVATLAVIIRGGRRVARVAVPAIVVGLAMFAGLGYLGYQRLPTRDQERVLKVARFEDPLGKERGLIQRAGLEIFRQQPVVGKAYGTYAILALERLAPSWYADLGKSTRTMLVPNYAHNELIEVLAEMGGMGGLIFLALLATAYATAVRVALRHPEPERARLGVAIAVGMTAFLFQNLFGVTFRQTGTVTFFWLSLGFLSVAQSRLGMIGGEGPQPVLREYRFGRLPVPALGVVGIGLVGITVLVTWLGIRPVESNVLVRQAEREARWHRFQTAAELADEGLKLNPYSTLGYYISAYAWGSLGDHGRSLRANERALELLPGNASVYYNLGVNYKELGRLEEARNSFKRAIALMPTAMRHHAAMAEVLLQMHRYDEALTYAKEAVQLEPRNADVRLLLADVEARRGDLKATGAQMEKASQLAPSKVSVLRQLADFYFRSRNYNRVADVCSRWLRVDPSAFPAYMLLGASRYNQKDYAAARAAFLKAVELNPDDHGARLRLAYACIHVKDSAQAYQQLKWLVSKQPDTPEGKEAARLLQAGTREPSGRAPVGANVRSRGGR